MKGRRFFLFAVVIMTFVMVAAFQGMAFCALVEIDFEQSQCYLPGNLYGQPTGATYQWGGNDNAKFQVVDTAIVPKQGIQSVRVKATSTGTDNYLQIGSLPSKFTWKFFWTPSTGGSGYTYTWLGSSSAQRDGPFLSFWSNDLICYRDGYIWKTIVEDLNQVPKDWLAVVVVGDITTHTFDVYLNGEANPTATNLPFAAGEPADLSYLGLGGSNTGSKYDYYDAIHVGAVPIPAAVLLLGSGFIGLVVVRRRFEAKPNPS
jgi:hypothetical protein